MYKAAAAGMLSSINSDSVSWSNLRSPLELKELRTEVSGKVTGIGAEMSLMKIQVCLGAACYSKFSLLTRED